METILVLEDDANLRALLSETLSDEGYNVREAASAEEAVSCARECSIHLVLSDVRMAGPVDGVGAIEQIKAFRPRIRSIVLTGYTDLDVPLRAARVQADDYLFKPVQLTQLLEVVRLTLDRDSTALDLLEQILRIPSDLAHKALAWIFEGKLQQLGQLRERCSQRLFVLLRSKRLSPEDAYPVYLQILEVESKYREAKPGDWGKLLSAYTAIESVTLAATAHETLTSSSNPALPWTKFRRFCRMLQEGEVSAQQFHQSAVLFLDPAARRVNLASYLSYQKLWAAEDADGQSPQTTDPLLGKTYGGYTLMKLLPEYTEARVYSAVNEASSSRLVMAFSSGGNTQEIVQDEVQAGRATPLGRHSGLDLILLNQQSHPLRRQLPPGGLPPGTAWKLVRPVFLQVQSYHKQGIYSGSVTLDDIEVIPGQSARLIRFSPEYALRVIREEHRLKSSGLSQHARMIQGALPLEIASASVNEPIPASDQAMLSYIFSRILLGLDFPCSGLVFFCVPQDDQIENHPTWMPLYVVCSQSVPELYRILARMAHRDPSSRYPSLGEAISSLDRLLSPVL